MRHVLLASLICLSFVSTSQAGMIVLEPDDYAAGTVLNTVIPEVTLFSTINSTDLTGNSGFNVTSADNGLASTGSRLFAHANVSFFNSNRNLRMTFTTPVASVSIDAIASTDFTNENAILTLYDSSGNQLDQLTSPGAGGGVARTVSLTRTMTDIKYAVVTSSGSFLRLDNLRYETEVVQVVPEPSTFALLGIGGLALVGYGWRRKRQQAA